MRRRQLRLFLVISATALAVFFLSLSKGVPAAQADHNETGKVGRGTW